MSNEKIEVVAADELGRRVRVKCYEDETIQDLKKKIGVLTATDWKKIYLKKWTTIYKDQVTLKGYEFNDGMTIDMVGVVELG